MPYNELKRLCQLYETSASCFKLPCEIYSVRAYFHRPLANLMHLYRRAINLSPRKKRRKVSRNLIYMCIPNEIVKRVTKFLQERLIATISRASTKCTVGDARVDGDTKRRKRAWRNRGAIMLVGYICQVT